MSYYIHDGGTTRQKIDVEKAKAEMLAEIAEIEGGADGQSRKTLQFKRLAQKVINRLYAGKRIKDDERISLTYYRAILRDLRLAIKKAGYRHHGLTNPRADLYSVENRKVPTLNYLIKTYPEYKELYEHLRTCDPTVLHNAKIRTLKAIKDSKSKNKEEAFNLTHALKVEHEVCLSLKLSASEKVDFKQSSSDALKEKQHNLIKYPYPALFKIVDENLESEYYTRLAFALGIVTGRRAYELMYTARFEYINENTLLFHGQAKKRAGSDNPPYQIKTLIDSRRVLSAFTKLRSHESIKELHKRLRSIASYDDRYKEFNRVVASSLNEMTKRLFNDDADRAFKDTRAIYTRVALDLLWAHDVQEEVFLAGLLGHESDNEQKHYKRFLINYNDKSTNLPEPENKTKKHGTHKTVLSQSLPLNKIRKTLESYTPIIEQYIKNNKIGKDVSVASKDHDGKEIFVKINSLLNLHNRVIEFATLSPDRAITNTALTKTSGFSFSRPLLETYLNVLSEQISAYNQSLISK